MELLKEYLPQWIGSNVIAILILIAAFKRPKLARLLFVLLFAWACWINFITSQNNPEDYLNYAAFTPFGVYHDFITGWFKEHITVMVTLISIGQGLIALGMLLKGWCVRLACLGAIIFFLGIAPLGIGSGFPSTIITSIAAYLIIKRGDHNYLWKFNSKKSTH